MSKQRQRDRAVREAKAKAAREPTSVKRQPQGATGPTKAGAAHKPAARKPAPKKQTVYRQRRFPPLPWRLKAALAVLWVTVLVLALLFVPTWQGRIGVMVLATFALPLIVVIVRDPSRRTR
jgi:hypothetical protein